MTAIGYVRKENDGRYKGHLRTVSIQAEIDIVPNAQKTSDSQPDFRVMTQGIEIGAGWQKTGETSGKEYVSLSIAAPEFGPKKLYANLGRAAGSDEENLYAVIWNPGDWHHHEHAPHGPSCGAISHAISTKKPSLMRKRCRRFFVFGGRIFSRSRAKLRVNFFINSTPSKPRADRAKCLW